MSEDAKKHKSFDLYDRECKAIGNLLSYLNDWNCKKENGDLYLTGRMSIFDMIGQEIGVIIDEEDGTFCYRTEVHYSKGNDPCSDSND